LAQTGIEQVELKILLLATDAFGGYGGIAQYNRDLITAMNNSPRVSQVDVLVRLGAGHAPATLPKVRQSAPVHSRILYAAQSLAKALRRPPDLVISAHLYHGPLASMVARLTGARLVSQLHGTEVWTGIAPQHVRPLERSDLILCVSRDTSSRIRSQVRMADERVLVVPNTVADAFSPGDRASVRARLGLGEYRMILTVARLDPRGGYKGHDMVIRALPELTSAHNGGLVYWIAGEGDDRARLQGLARDLGVADQVRFMGKTSLADLLDLYRAADLFVLPSSGEGFGIAFIEAMACGTPALGLAVGGAPDALGDGELGICVTAQAFPEALRKALDAPRPDPQELHAGVIGRFGRHAFQRNIDMMLERIASGVAVA
jgi:phosphatidylinositol alpha-1,6-mannosyltransferase